MKTAALIAQSLVLAMTLLAAIRFPHGSYSYAPVPFVTMGTSLATIVALVRPLARIGQKGVIAINSLFVVFSGVALVLLVYYEVVYGNQHLLLGGFAIAIFAVPYLLSIIALRRQTPRVVEHSGEDAA